MLATNVIAPSLAASATAWVSSASLHRSVLMKIIWPPMSRAIFWVFLPSFSLMSRPTVIRLFAAAAMAVARPIPVPAPVTMHTLPTLKFVLKNEYLIARDFRLLDFHGGAVLLPCGGECHWNFLQSRL